MSDSNLSGLAQEEHHTNTNNIEEAEPRDFVSPFKQNKDPGIHAEKEANTGLFYFVEEATKEVKGYIIDKVKIIEFVSNNPGMTGAAMILIGGTTLMWPVWLSLLLIGGGAVCVWHSIKNK